jgi:AcrR family transcriptional regulator
VSPIQRDLSHCSYAGSVPKLWEETVDAHRREVRDAILDTTAALVAEHGLRGVTMSQIAEDTGIGRATLYRYFPDVEAVLLAWHKREVSRHLTQLTEICERSQPGKRLEAVLEAFAFLAHQSRGHDDSDLATLLHQHHDHQLGRAHQHVHDLFRNLLAEAAHDGQVRRDVPVDELASYCLHAASAAARLPSKAAVRRLVTVTLAGLGQVG